MGQTKVLYIVGSNRCGSTLLARVLGDLPGYFAIGEGLVHFFCGSSEDHVPCGCGLSVQDCSFWKGTSLPLEEAPFAARWLRLRRTPFLGAYCRRYPQQISGLIASLGNFYDTVARRSGAEVIVDSSKNPLHARLLSWVPNIDLYVVFLVRDPRSVVASSRQPKQWLPGASPLHATMRWLGLMLGSEYLRTRVRNWRRLRYEDFVKEPRRAILDITGDLGYGVVESPYLAGCVAELGPQHMLGSNPDKLKSGPTRIADRSVHLPWLGRFLVSVLTAPLLLRYGYWGNGSRFQTVASPEIAVMQEMAGQGAKVDSEIEA
ncbi:MAG TPA: sulfotransferase [Terriglobales bacterium]|jgi:hypothetical protein|nr:sulfotransferase [Terriglobales bacterium]